MITLLTVGKLKESYWHEACEEYLKRLSPYLKIKVIEIPEIPFGKNIDSQKIKKEEAEKILKYIKEDSYVVALTYEGKKFSSEEFAKKLESWQQQNLIFIIGGPLGLHESLKNKANENLSLSPLTFTHQMARVILLEQIYRSVMMSKNKYHY